MTPRPESAPRYKAWLMPALTAVVFAVALWVLGHSLKKLSWDKVWDYFQAIPPQQVLWAALFTIGSYSALTLYDFLALLGVRRPLPYRSVAVTSFIAYALAHSVGASTLSGGAVRLRSYTAKGLSALEVAAVVALCVATFTLGIGTLLGLSLVLRPDEAEKVLRIPGLAAQAIGAALLSTVGAYLLFNWLRKRPFRLARWTILAPGLRLTSAQLLTSCFDLCCAAATLYVLLPGSVSLSYPAFVGLYVLAIAAGVISNVPGGLGVFESVLILLLPGVKQNALIGAVLLYRVIYYVAPFALGVLLLAVREYVWARRDR